MSDVIRVVVADDQQVVREGLVALLRRGPGHVLEFDHIPPLISAP